MGWYGTWEWPNCRLDEVKTHSLLVCLVDGIHGILDGDALEVARGDLHSQGEVEVNLLDGRFRQWDLEDARVLHR